MISVLKKLKCQKGKITAQEGIKSMAWKGCFFHALIFSYLGLKRIQHIIILLLLSSSQNHSLKPENIIFL